MEFHPYPKIPLRPASSPGGRWIATEKIHGANFVVGLADDRVRFGKRKEWLASDAPFFGWQLLARELEEQVRALAAGLGVRALHAYGELFGGAYPHPAVAPVPGLSAVQTGVWYCPGLRWALFDARVDGGEWVAIPALFEQARAVGLFTPPVRGRGRRAELELLPVEFVSAVPAALGLPPLPDNLAEGLVLKPERGGEARPALKKKIAAFSEARFGEAEAWDPGSVDPAALLHWAAEMVNPARLASARSKVGTDRDAVLDEVVLDVGLDLEAAFPLGWDEATREQVLARVRTLAEALL